MILGRHQLLELEALLHQLLRLKDADFTKFLNNSEALKPFFTCLQGFWSTAAASPVDELVLSLHEKFFKFLLRLCPSSNRKSAPAKAPADEAAPKPLRAVICPKRAVDCLFESDPLGLLCYLHETWNPSDLLDTVRDELVPTAILKHPSFIPDASSNRKCNEFIKWLTRNTFKGTLRTNERESILKRFEYESDDDFFEGEDTTTGSGSGTGTNSSPDSTVFDPLQVALFSAYIACPSIFSRTSACRSSKPRAELLAKTKLSHEQVEGWAVMLERNPKRANVIQDFIIWNKSAH